MPGFSRYLYLCAATIVALWLFDGVTAVRPPPLPPTPAAARPAPLRTFILIVDSLRYETAMDASVMPSLARLRRLGACARMQPSFNAVTVPSLRAAFTGRDEVSIFAFVHNFRMEDAHVESVFTALRRAGITAGAASSGCLLQFGAALRPNFAYPDAPATEQDDQDRAALDMMARLQRGELTVAVAHIDYTDHAAHEHDVGTPAYVQAFRRADGLVDTLARTIGPRDVLLVMGDHGHSRTGSHSIGMDVPTFAVISGPPIRAGQNLGTFSITGIRYLLSGLYRLPLTAETYAGPECPQAFVPGWKPPPIAGIGRGGFVWRNEVARWLAVAGFLAVVALLVVQLWLRPATATPVPAWIRLLFWVVLGFGITAHPGALFVAVAIGSAAFLADPDGRTTMAKLRLLAAVCAATVIAIGSGAAYAAKYAAVVGLHHGWIAAGWCSLAALLIAGMRHFSRTTLLLTGAAVCGVALWPTISASGLPGAMVPLLWLWVLLLLAPVAAKARRDVLTWLILAALFLFTQPLAGVDARFPRFNAFAPLLIGFDENSFAALVLIAAAAKLVLCFASVRGVRARIAATRLLLSAGLLAMEFHVWSPAPTQAAATILALAGAAWACRGAVGWRYTFQFGLGWFLFYYWVDRGVLPFVWTDSMAASIVLAARLIPRWADAADAAIDRAWLAAIAVLMCGYGTSGWSIQDLEWHRAYDWFSAGTVEHRAYWFVPWIVAKTLLPLWLAHLAVNEAIGPLAPAHPRRLQQALSCKILALILAAAGAVIYGKNPVAYLEIIQLIVLLGVFTLGLLLLDVRETQRPMEVRSG